MKLYIRTSQTADRIVLKVDVPGPYETTDTEVHVANSIEEMKEIISRSAISKEDVYEVSGCDLDDLFEEAKKSMPSRNPALSRKAFQKETGLKLRYDTYSEKFSVIDGTRHSEIVKRVREYNQNHQTHITVFENEDEDIDYIEGLYKETIK